MLFGAEELLRKEDEEELALELAFIGNVGAVDCISVDVRPIKCSKRVPLTSVCLTDIGIISATKLLEALNDVLLADLKGDARTTYKLVDRVGEVTNNGSV